MTHCRGIVNNRYDAEMAVSGGGACSGLTKPNGSITGYQYDSLNRLTSLTNRDSSSATINGYDYIYNSQDLRSSETITNGNPITSFTAEKTLYDYNTVNQLLTTTNPNQGFAYDADGNMTQGYTPEGYVFTAAYDAENRLKSLTYTDSSNVVHKTEYYYAGDSFLSEVKRYEDANLVSDTRHVRSGPMVIQERDGSNSVTAEYTWGLNMGGGIGGLLHLRKGGENYSYLYDGKGNVTAIIDGTQAVVATYTYDTFGTLMSKTGTLDQPYRFSTKAYDEKTGLVYYGYRFYSPAIGRWINRDPLGEAGGMNLYGFVGNNPVNYFDPFGLWDAQAAAEYLTNPANGWMGTRSRGRCAAAVRRATNAGGVATPNNPISASAYQNYLPSVGFQQVNLNGYQPQTGDIAVFPPTASNPHGHIEMYTGNRWQSDYVQPPSQTDGSYGTGFFANQNWVNSSFTIFRYGGSN